MKKIIILYSFLIFQIIINAQQNDITSLKFTWISYLEYGRVDVQNICRLFKSLSNKMEWW